LNFGQNKTIHIAIVNKIFPDLQYPILTISLLQNRVNAKRAISTKISTYAKCFAIWPRVLLSKKLTQKRETIHPIVNTSYISTQVVLGESVLRSICLY